LAKLINKFHISTEFTHFFVDLLLNIILSKLKRSHSEVLFYIFSKKRSVGEAQLHADLFDAKVGGFKIFLRLLLF